jgi:hypothetical protein
MACCSCWSHGKIDKTWTHYDGSGSERSIEDFWNELKHGLNPDLVAQADAQRQEIESLGLRLGVPPENASYHIWDIFKDRADNSISFELAPGLFSSAGAQAFHCAVKIFGKGCWNHPWDVMPGRDPLPHASSLPVGFLSRSYDPSDASSNESFHIDGLSKGRGGILFAYIPPIQSSSAAKVLVIRVRVFESSSPQERFIQMLNPHWKIENVSGDGNCAYWAVLRSLQELQLHDSSLELRKFEVVPGNYNALNPQPEDYQLMNRLRRATSEEAKREIVATNWNVIREHMIGVLSLNHPEGSPADQFIIPEKLNLENIRMDRFQAMISLFCDLDISLFRWDLCAQVSSGTRDSLEKLQENERRNNILRPTEPEHYRYLMERVEPTDLWLRAIDVQHLAQAMKLPLLLIAPRDQNPAAANLTGTIKDKIGCFFYDENGKTLLISTDSRLLGDGCPARIAELLSQYPNTVKFVYNGINHFLAIVGEE